MQLYVSYAKQEPPDNDDDVTGPGLGMVNVFDLNGNLVKHLIAVGGALNAPWGMALAPADFGTLGNTLLVGNFGDGKINAFDPASGAVGRRRDGRGWHGLRRAGPVGHRVRQRCTTTSRATRCSMRPAPTTRRTAAFGRIDLGATPPILNAPPVVAVSAAGGQPVRAPWTVTATATASVAIAKVEFFAERHIDRRRSTTSPYSVSGTRPALRTDRTT